MSRNLLDNIKATMAAEDIFITEQDENLIIKYYKGEITEKEGIEIIKNRFKDVEDN